MIHVVRFTKKAIRQLEEVPVHVANKVETWVEAVELEGLESVRQISGYHDEALKGKRQGQRSIRLNKSYRAIYEIHNDGTVTFVSIEEVSKHEY